MDPKQGGGESLDSFATLGEIRAATIRYLSNRLTELGFVGGEEDTTFLGGPQNIYPGECYISGKLLQLTPDFCLTAGLSAGKRRRADLVLGLRVSTNPEGRWKKGVGKNLYYSYLTIEPGWESRLKKGIECAKEVAESLQKSTPRCPLCSGVMIQKQLNKTGHPHEGEEFWGCWRYPDCHGIRASWRDPNEDPDVGKIMRDLRCPECQGPMVIRIARKGKNAGKKFYGCCRYPECKGTLGRLDAIAQALMQDRVDDNDWRRS